MVKLNTIIAANAASIKQQPLVAVFVGATNGIGEYTVRELCKTHGSDGRGLEIFLLARNATTAQSIIAQCASECSRVNFHFVQIGDISLLQSVDTACEQVLQILNESNNTDEVSGRPRIDLLVMSQGKVEFGARQDTKEGLNISMSLLYYSRMRFISRLLPLLLASELHTGAHVISIYAGGLENKGKLFPDDLSLDEADHYGFANCRTHCIAMKTMYFEHLANSYPGKLSLVHLYPGLVVHAGFDDPNFPLWFRIIWRLVRPLAKLFSISPRDIGQRVLYLGTARFPAKGVKPQDNIRVVDATDGIKGGGAYSVNQASETCNTAKFYSGLRRQGFQASVVQHTKDVFDSIGTHGKYMPQKGL